MTDRLCVCVCVCVCVHRMGWNCLEGKLKRDPRRCIPHSCPLIKWRGHFVSITDHRRIFPHVGNQDIYMCVCVWKRRQWFHLEQNDSLKARRIGEDGPCSLLMGGSQSQQRWSTLWWLPGCLLADLAYPLSIDLSVNITGSHWASLFPLSISVFCPETVSEKLEQSCFLSELRS